MKNKTVIKGFSAGNDEPMEKEDVKDRIGRESWPFLDAYFKDAPDSGRWTSQEICDNVVRFAPVIYGPEQMKGMHGLNENIDLFSLTGAVTYFKTLVRRNS